MVDKLGDILVIGVGNPYRGDDRAGLLVAHELMDKAPEHVVVVINYGEMATLLEMLGSSDHVIFIDAVAPGSEPGKLHRFEVDKKKLPVEFFRFSTHAFSIPEAIELARAMGQLPGTVVVYGIEGAQFELGDSLSPEVEGSISEVVERILADIESISSLIKS